MGPLTTSLSGENLISHVCKEEIDETATEIKNGRLLVEFRQTLKIARHLRMQHSSETVVQDPF